MAPLHYVGRDGNLFVVGAQEFKFVGFNIRGQAHYGYGDGILPKATAAQRAEFLAEAQAVGASVVQLFLPHVKVGSDDELIERLGVALENGRSVEDRFLAQRLNKPLIIEEVGRVHSRAGFFRENMDFWFSNGASGYLGWGSMPSVADNGDGDDDFGIDRALHNDFNEVTQVW